MYHIGVYRWSKLVPCLNLASPAILPMSTSGLQLCTETLFGIIGHNYCLSRLFYECRTHRDCGWDLGPGSRIFDGTGLQIVCNNGRYEFLTTSIAEDFITWTSKSSLTSWRWQLDWAVFQYSGDVTTRMMVVHFYLTIRHDPHRRDCRVNWRKILRLSQAYANILPLSGDFKVLDLWVDDIDLEWLCAIVPVMTIRMYLPR